MKILAFGDSWFHYPQKTGNIIYYLNRNHDYGIDYREKLFSVIGQGASRKIRSKDDVLGENGEDLINMAYNTLLSPKGKPFTPSWLDMLEARIDKAAGKDIVLLLSGGGNDLAGQELKQMLNPVASGLPLLNLEMSRALINVKLRKAYTDIMDKVKARCTINGSTVRFLVHGYAYPPVNGKAAVNVPSLKVGPWLKPYFQQCGENDRAKTEAVMRVLIDDFNSMLKDLAATDNSLHHIDLRGIAEQNDTDWQNELHLTGAKYQDAALEFDKVLRSL